MSVFEIWISFLPLWMHLLGLFYTHLIISVITAACAIYFFLYHSLVVRPAGNQSIAKRRKHQNKSINGTHQQPRGGFADQSSLSSEFTCLNVTPYILKSSILLNSLPGFPLSSLSQNSLQNNSLPLGSPGHAPLHLEGTAHLISA